MYLYESLILCLMINCQSVSERGVLDWSRSMLKSPPMMTRGFLYFDKTLFMKLRIFLFVLIDCESKYTEKITVVELKKLSIYEIKEAPEERSRSEMFGIDPESRIVLILVSFKERRVSDLLGESAGAVEAQI